jgi:hypothetical protein
LKEFGFSRYFIFISRLIAVTLLFVANPSIIVLAYTLFGLSSAGFYKVSREFMKNILKETETKLHNPYIIFSISTNLAFIMMPLAGSFLLKQSLQPALLLISNLILCVCGYLIYPLLFAKKDNSLTKEEPTQETQNSYEKIQWTDSLRLISFLLAYSIMITLPPGKVSKEGLGSEYSAYFYTINGIIIVLSQTLLANNRIMRFSFLKFDLLSIVALISIPTAIYSNYTIFLIAFTIWTLTEAYQMPAIEYLLFSKRNYSEKTISRLLVLDSLICLMGPLITARILL